MPDIEARLTALEIAIGLKTARVDPPCVFCGGECRAYCDGWTERPGEPGQPQYAEGYRNPWCDRPVCDTHLIRLPRPKDWQLCPECAQLEYPDLYAEWLKTHPEWESRNAR